MFLAVEDSNFVKQDCLFPCPNCPTLPRCLDENGTQPTSDSGAWVGASLANEHVVSITMGLLAGWVARCQALNVEGVTCVRSTISWYNCVSQTSPRIHRDSTKEGGQGWGSEQPCRGPVHSERGPGRAAWLGVFPCFGFLVCWILEPKAMRARRQGKSYSLLIFPLHWQNGSNYMMVALNVIKGIQSPEARLSHNHDKLLKTAEIAPSLRRRGKSWWCWLKSAALACNRRLSTWKGDSCDFIRSEGVLGSFPRFVPSGHSCELQL